MNAPTFLKKQWALSRLLAQLRRQPTTILLFHSVGRGPEADFLPSSLNCDPEFFEQLLKFLQRHAAVLPLHELAIAIGARRAPRHAVALTFDDGFCDNYLVAWPLLQQYKLPATFFVATDAINKPELLPVHKFYYLANRKHFAFPRSMALDLPERRRVVDELCTGLHLGTPSAEKLYMNWHQVKELADNGMEIGAHTCSHPWVAAIPPEQQRSEIVGSKEILENMLGRPIHSFAYPYGFGYSVNPSAFHIVREHFDVACLTRNVAADPNDPWKLPRSNIAEFYVS